MSEGFFEECRDQSLIKATIVEKYFVTWAKIILRTAKREGYEPKIAYIDLFAGPGRYDDGTLSTPLRVLKTAIADSELTESLITTFNDREPDSVQSLKSAISDLPGIGSLRYPPEIFNTEINEEIERLFEGVHLVPTLFFFDPWGYKGLSLGLINAVLKDWGSECIFFFNYNRINPGLGNCAVEMHMNQLFGKARADELRLQLDGMSPHRRELTILEALTRALTEVGGKYVLPFTFKNEKGSRTSHHLFFVSKHPLGYEKMKEIMAKESTSSPQGVPSFEYNPATIREPLLFDYARPLDDLKDMLCRTFAGRSLSVERIYSEHNVGKWFIKRNYKDVIRLLEDENRISVKPACLERRKGTLCDNCVVTFPKVITQATNR